VLWKEVPCHTCFRDECPYENRCIKLIAPFEAITAADRILARANQGRAPERASLSLQSA
jgi:hypothetical protein